MEQIDPPLQYAFGVTGDVAADRNRARQAGNMGRIRLNGARKRGHRAAEALRAYAGRIHFVQNCVLHLRIKSILAVLANRAQQRNLRQFGSLVGCAAQAHADDGGHGLDPA